MSATALLGAMAAGENAPRVLVVAAHPDDETIGMGALLSRLRDVTVLHVTDGAPRDGRDARAHGFADVAAYATARRQEALSALALAGIAPERALALGIPDQAATFHLVTIALHVAEVIARLRPALVVTHAYEGGHPDHDAVAFAVRAAIRRAPAQLAEMTGYHADGSGMATGRFLPAASRAIAFPAGAGLALKRRMLGCFATQHAVLAGFPPGDEWLRPAPQADFTRPPHDGALFYERFPWGMDGARFRAAASLAMDRLA
jgi:LmbE family N-acetylglucosaminyl deacetylase